MKKIILILIILVFASSLCFAQTASKFVERQTITGKVESVTPGDASKRINPEITVVDGNGETFIFKLRSTATINDKNGKVITLDKLTADSKVAVEYITTNKGVNRTKFIKVLE